MRLKNLATGALTGGLLTSALIALMYVADEWADLAFVPFDLFDWIAGILPGPVITFGIDLLIDTMLGLGLSIANTAKTAEQALAIGQFLGIGIGIGVVLFAISSIRMPTSHGAYGAIVFAVIGIPLIVISLNSGMSSAAPFQNIIWLVLLFVGWGMLLARASIKLRFTSPKVLPEPVALPDTDEPSNVRAVELIDRRHFLIKMGATTATITIAGAGLGRILETNARRSQERELTVAMSKRIEPSKAAILPNANDPVIPAPGTRLEYTPVEDHYKVFLRLEPSELDGDTWTLPIDGLVENPMVLNLDEVRNRYEPRSQYVTLTCISGRVGTDLIGTTLWTGFSLQDLIDDLKPMANAQYLVFVCADGFYETVDLDLIASDERIMLAYDWDGMPIPKDHGFPLRIWLPDRYGMKQPKWITQIQVVDEYMPGYWVERGWDEVAQIRATSVVDTVAVDSVYEDGSQMRVPVGGIAFAGARGISKVEVRVDGAGEWRQAQLRSPLSETTWVFWRYDWPFEEGRHTFQVRCVEADGTPQIEKNSPNRPSGATGIHQRDGWL
ncbi:MAG: molybdopterin-dependent oxidoreductase [SAR202 cluster bacterium]|nr:molybdopterin-dependent oxidoreductase [SAR202 cluster bacterium]